MKKDAAAFPAWRSERKDGLIRITICQLYLKPCSTNIRRLNYLICNPSDLCDPANLRRRASKTLDPSNLVPHLLVFSVPLAPILICMSYLGIAHATKSTHEKSRKSRKSRNDHSRQSTWYYSESSESSISSSKSSNCA